MRFIAANLIFFLCAISCTGQNTTFKNHSAFIHPYRLPLNILEFIGSSDDYLKSDNNPGITFINIPYSPFKLSDGDYLYYFDTMAHTPDSPFLSQPAAFNPAALVHYENGERNGPFEIFSYSWTRDKRKVTTVRGAYKNGQKHGLWSCLKYGDFGILLDSSWCNYDNGLLNGLCGENAWKDPIYRGNYLNGKKQGWWTQLNDSAYFDSGNATTNFVKNLSYNVKLKGKLHNGFKEGKYEAWDEKDNLLFAVYIYNNYNQNHVDSGCYETTPLELLKASEPLLNKALGELYSSLYYKILMPINNNTGDGTTKFDTFECFRNAMRIKSGVISRKIISFKYVSDGNKKHKPKPQYFEYTKGLVYKYYGYNEKLATIYEEFEYLNNILVKKRVLAYHPPKATDWAYHTKLNEWDDYSSHELMLWSLYDGIHTDYSESEFVQNYLNQTKGMNLGKWTYNATWYVLKTGKIPSHFLADSNRYIYFPDKEIRTWKNEKYLGEKNSLTIWENNFIKTDNYKKELIKSHDTIVAYRLKIKEKVDEVEFMTETTLPFQQHYFPVDSLKQAMYASENYLYGYDAGAIEYIWPRVDKMPLRTSRLFVNGKPFNGAISSVNNTYGYQSDSDLRHHAFFYDFYEIREKKDSTEHGIYFTASFPEVKEKKSWRKRKKNTHREVNVMKRILKYKDGYLTGNVYADGYDDKNIINYSAGVLNGYYKTNNLSAHFNYGRLQGIVTNNCNENGSTADNDSKSDGLFYLTFENDQLHGACQFIYQQNSSYETSYHATFQLSFKASYQAHFCHDTITGEYKCIGENGYVVDSFGFDNEGNVHGNLVKYHEVNEDSLCCSAKKTNADFSNTPGSLQYGSDIKPLIKMTFSHGKPVGIASFFGRDGDLQETVSFDSNNSWRPIVWNAREHRLKYVYPDRAEPVLTDNESLYGTGNILQIDVSNKLNIKAQNHTLNIYNLTGWPGYHKYYYKNGIASAEGAVDMGLRTGWWSFYNEAGNLYKKINYVSQKLVKLIPGHDSFICNGMVEGYNRTGKIMYKGYILDESFTSICATNAELSITNIFYTSIYDSTGNNVMEKSHSTKVAEYNLSGNLAYEGYWLGGQRDSIWRFYSQNGSLIQIGKYKNGLKQGRWLSGSLSGFNYQDNVCFNENDTTAVFELRKKLEFTESIWKNGELLAALTSKVEKDGISEYKYEYQTPRLYFNTINPKWSKKRKKYILTYGIDLPNYRIKRGKYYNMAPDF